MRRTTTVPAQHPEALGRLGLIVGLAASAAAAATVGVMLDRHHRRHRVPAPAKPGQVEDWENEGGAVPPSSE
jgi:hypothetical protein